MPRLIGQSAEIAGKTFDLAEAVVTVGRTANNLVHLPDNSVSSKHAELRLEGLDYMVRDLDSTNGVRVNGEKVTTANLRRNDLIRFGNVELLYESEHDPVTVPLPPAFAGLALEGCASRGRPPHFVGNESPHSSKPKDPVPWKLLASIVVVLMLLALSYLALVLLTTPQP